jgi:ribonuclease HI
MSKRQTLQALLNELGIKDWDVLLVGDGSGSAWNMGSGWGCVSIEKATQLRRSWYGACNLGSTNLAEIMAYIHPLTWYAREQVKSKSSQFKQIHIITDSSYLASKGMQDDNNFGLDKAIWHMFDVFQSFGLVLNWHWARRETVELNCLVDRISKDARKNLAELFEEKTLNETMYLFNKLEEK